MATSTVQLAADEVARFAIEGYLCIPGFYDVESEIVPIQRGIYDLIGLVADEAGIELEREAFSPADFDGGLNELLATDRALVSRIYDATKKLWSYVKLACSGKNGEIAAAVLGAKTLGFANRGYGIRMDNPGESQYLTHLHQDYISQLCSPRGVVLWSPLRRADAKTVGCVRIFPGSHQSGVLRVRKVGQGSEALQIEEEGSLRDRFSGITPTVEVGDLVVIDYLLLHESTPNLANSTRWAMISRFFDLEEATGRSYGWHGGLQEGNSFEAVHPDMVTTNP
jgi:hypothetical protein